MTNDRYLKFNIKILDYLLKCTISVPPPAHTEVALEIKFYT